MTSIRHPDDAAQVQAIALRKRNVERRREALENLQRLAVQLETASALDRRADRSNPTLAAVLRERADERRRIAAVIRAHLDSQGVRQARSAGSSAGVTFSGWSLRNRYQ
jgi:hypothetical protein